eukprot:m.185421 g.185421  ORF g.185421 m.185421 type:complete len:130 (+) comp13605_c1_seq6:7266-7655(+)
MREKTTNWGMEEGVSIETTNNPTTHPLKLQQRHTYTHVYTPLHISVNSSSRKSPFKGVVGSRCVPNNNENAESHADTNTNLNTNKRSESKGYYKQNGFHLVHFPQPNWFHDVHEWGDGNNNNSTEDSLW